MPLRSSEREVKVVITVNEYECDACHNKVEDDRDFPCAICPEGWCKISMDQWTVYACGRTCAEDLLGRKVFINP